MYGPIAQAIEQLLAADRARPQKKTDPTGEEFRANIARCWRAIAQAQDDFYDDVKGGRIEKSE